MFINLDEQRVFELMKVRTRLHILLCHLNTILQHNIMRGYMAQRYFTY